MHEIEDRIRSYKDTPWCSNPKAYQNIAHEDDDTIVFKDRFPVTEGHLLFVPKKVTRQLDITRCFELAYKWGVRGICEHEWDAFNVGINNGEAAGQSVMWPHVHLIPRKKGDTPYPKGGVRHVIPLKGNYDDTTEDDWENEGGMALPYVDDNTSREELDEATRMPMSAPIFLQEKSVKPSPGKVDEVKWAKIVQRMKDKEKRKDMLKKYEGKLEGPYDHLKEGVDYLDDIQRNKNREK